jgi:hypothetical protein
MQPFLEALSEDANWTLIGTSDWAKTYEGRQAIQKDLLNPLFSNFADQYTNKASRFIAENDTVVVEAKGRVNTKSGKPYNNTYCFIFRVSEGKIKEITEYCDTELAAKTFGGASQTARAAGANGKAAESMAAILKLYELRRDEKMRQSRAWYFSDFAPKSAFDIINLYREGEQASAYFRMITSYWDMASSFVLNGALDEKMFLDASTEHIFVYAKIQPFLAEIRELFGEPDYLLNLETLVRRVPDIESKIQARKRLFKLWTKETAAAESN